MTPMALGAMTAMEGGLPAAAEAARRGAADAATHTQLALFYEAIGRRAMAAQHFDRAVVVGPEYARGWYEKGRFYEDADDGQARSREAWTRYLGLSPSGPRAERVSSYVATR